MFILADDLGYGDLGCYGHPRARTPRLDQLAQQGVRFTQHYANGPECSPTRTALLTGRYQQRVGGLECAIGTGNVGRYDDAIRLAEQHQLGLPADQAVLPRALGRGGYASAVFGKWHLGYEPHFNPREHGWDEFFGYLGGNVDYFTHRELSDLPVLFQDRAPVTREGYMTHLITEQAIDFVKRHRERPFLLYVSHECPHFPFQGPGDRGKVVTADNWTTPDAKTYVAMLEDLDRQVGRLLDALRQQQLERKTVVIFVSDNGGLAGVAHLGKLRGAKGTTFEGGIRVPLIIRWPGELPAGAVSAQVCVTFDLTRSILALAGAGIPDEKLDGYDIIDHVRRGRSEIPRTLFWRGRRGDRTWWAVRDGGLKWVRKRDGQEDSQWLFDVADDLAETRNLLAARPADAQRLRSLVRRWEAEVRPAR